MVLDNFEHVVDAAAELVPIIDAAPRLTLLVTSRSVLRLSAERVVDVRPLDAAAARELLASRVTASGVEVDPDSAALRRGLRPARRDPARDRARGPVVSLAVGVGAAPASRLPARRARRRCPGCAGAPSHDARRDRLELRPARSGGAASPRPRVALPEQVHARGGDRRRRAESRSATRSTPSSRRASSIASASGYGLLEVVREYGLELPSAGAEGHDLHAAYFADLAERAESELSGPDQGAWLERLEAAHDDLRGALDWLGEQGEPEPRLRLAASLGRFWYVRGYLSEGLERLAEAVERAPGADPALIAKALRTASALAVLQGDYSRARALAERALALYREIGDETGIVRSLSNLGAILLGLGELERAADSLDECIDAAEALGEAQADRARAEQPRRRRALAG